MPWGWAPSLPRSVPVTGPSTALGMSALLGAQKGPDAEQRQGRSASGADRERCGAENSGGTRLFQRKREG